MELTNTEYCIHEKHKVLRRGSTFIVGSLGRGHTNAGDAFSRMGTILQNEAGVVIKNGSHLQEQPKGAAAKEKGWAGAAG